MRVVDLIQRKREGGELSKEEIGFFINGVVKGEIPDYQTSALLMAICFTDLTDEELVAWIECVVQSAPALDLSSIPGPKVSKHSAGGVGDKTSLIVGPLVAAAGITVPMMVGRGMSYTGGTLDKIESIPGFNAGLTADELKAVLRNVQLAMAANTNGLIPAEKKLYALRDATATVESVALITASILSRELAEGVDGLVVDVTTGSGSLTAKMTDARRLAQRLVTAAKRMGKKVVSVITDMDQPLGNAVGNALEVMEAIETMRGNGPEGLVEVSLELGARMVMLAHPDRTVESAKEQLYKLLNEGAALQKFRQTIEVQGGNPQVIDNFELLPNASAEYAVSSPRSGFVSRISADDIGRAAMLLGAGREKMDSNLDAAVGVVLEHKTGDRIQVGERLCTIYYNEDTHLEEATQMVEDAFHISSSQPEARPLIYEVIQ